MHHYVGATTLLVESGAELRGRQSRAPVSGNSPWFLPAQTICTVLHRGIACTVGVCRAWSQILQPLIWHAVQRAAHQGAALLGSMNSVRGIAHAHVAVHAVLPSGVIFVLCAGKFWPGTVVRLIVASPCSWSGPTPGWSTARSFMATTSPGVCCFASFPHCCCTHSAG